MTAKQLFIEIEEKLREALAMCDITGATACSDGTHIDNDSVARVMTVAVVDLGEVIEKCEAACEE